MNHKNIRLECLLISTWFLGIMAVKFILPSLPNIVDQLETSQTLAKYTISIFLFGKATGMLVFGPLSEKYGRKIFMLIGLALFSIGNFIAFYAESIELLLIARLIQGLGVSGSVMVGRAMINDRFDNNKAAIIFSHVFLVAALIISFLPMIGSLLATNFDWHVTFLVMGTYSSLVFILCLLFLDETHHDRIGFKISMGQALAYYKLIASHPVFLGYVFCSICMIAGESAFNTASAFLFIKTYHLSKNYFGFLITFLAIGHLLGTLFCGQLVKKYNLVKMMGTGVILLAISSVLMAILLNVGFNHLLVIIIPMSIFFIGTGFVMTIVAVGPVVPFPKLIGISSAAALSLNFFFSGLSSAIMSHLSTHTAKPVSILIAICGIAAFFSWYWLIVPGRKTHRKYIDTNPVYSESI